MKTVLLFFIIILSIYFIYKIIMNIYENQKINHILDYMKKQTKDNKEKKNKIKSWLYTIRNKEGE